MTRLSTYFLPTEREPPSDAEAISHKLMVRAGLIRQVGSGLWSWLPAGYRVHQRIVQIVREEMNAIGAHEMLMPVLQPADYWRRTGRYDIDELFKLNDRRGADMVLAMTHEEIVTTHVAAAVKSYRDLPLILYHFQVKERDEPRPRAGVLRTREFIMKDSYSFDRDPAGLDASYQKHVVAYDRMMDRCGLEWYRVEADVGMMGGSGAHEYMAPCPAGENDVAVAAGYAANVEVASAEPQPVTLEPALDAPALVSTPGMTTIDAVATELERAGGRAAQGVPGDRRRRRDEARGRTRRPSGQRDQARDRTRDGVPPRPSRRGGGAARSARLHRPGGGADADPARRRRRRRRLCRRRQRSRTPTCAASSRAATSRSSASTCAR